MRHCSRDIAVKMAAKSEGTDNWRYVVVLAKFIVHVLHPGIIKALSVLIPVLVFQLDLDYTTVGFLVPMQFATLYLACPIGNCLSTKFGPRRVATISGFLSGLSLMGTFFCYSALSMGWCFFFAGLFSSPIRQTSAVMLREYFGEMFGMATTFTQTGSLVGGIILPYVTVICMDAYGMRGTLLCLSGILFFQAANGAAMRPPRHYDSTEKKCKPRKTRAEEIELKTGRRQEDISSSEESELCIQDRQEEHSEEASHAETKNSKTWSCIVDSLSWIFYVDLIKKERIFALLLLPCQFVGELAYTIWITFCVSYGLSVGLTEKEAAYLVMAGSLGGFIDRLILIAILYKYPRLSTHMFPVNMAVSTIALLAYPIDSSLPYLLSCSFFAGSGFSGFISCFYASIGLRVKKENFSDAMSLTFFVCGVTFLISGTFAGALYEVIGSFKVIFRTAGIFLLLPCGIFSIFLIIDAQSKRSSS